MKTKLWLTFCRALPTFLFVGHMAAQACSPAPIPKTPPTQRELADNEAGRFRNSEGLVEVFALSSSNPSGTAARARVIRSYKGNMAPGSIIEFHPLPPLCPVPQMIAGTHGLTYLFKRGSGWVFEGYLTRADVAELRRRRLIGNRRA